VGSPVSRESVCGHRSWVTAHACSRDGSGSHVNTLSRRVVSFGCAVVAAAAAAGSGSAGVGAELSPPVSLADTIQLYSLSVPTTRPNTTERVILTAPPGFTISSFVPSPGWQRAFTIGTRNGALIEKVVWSGGRTASRDESLFQFLGEPMRSGTLVFRVEQTYADGTTVSWSGPENSITPAPTIDVKNALGSVNRTPLLSWLALILASCGVIVATVALLADRERPPE
jgi:uncharacterized protein YcnI